MMFHTQRLCVRLVHRTTCLPSPRVVTVASSFNCTFDRKRRMHSTSDAALVGFTEGWSPIVLMQNTVEAAHIYGHMPWWLAILSTSLVLRPFITLPCTIYQQRALARLELLQPNLENWREALKHHVAGLCRREGKTYEEYTAQLNKEVKAKYKELYQRHQCHPLRAAVYPLIQLPVWVVFSLALRQISGFPVPHLDSTNAVSGFDAGGILWFTDLTAPDTMLVFPIVTGVCHLMNIELSAVKRLQSSKRQTILTNTFRGLSIVMMFVASTVPSAISMYWATSSLYRLGENIALRYPAVRRKLHIPETPSESDTPLKDAWTLFKDKHAPPSSTPPPP